MNRCLLIMLLLLGVVPQVFSCSKFAGTLNVEGTLANPQSVDVDTDGTVYIAEEHSKSVTKWNGDSKAKILTMRASNMVTGVALRSGTDQVWYATFFGNEVGLFNKNTGVLIKRFTVKGAFAPSFRPSTNEVWVSRWMNKVSVYDANSYAFIRDITTGSGPMSIGFGDNIAYVPQMIGNKVTTFNLATGAEMGSFSASAPCAVRPHGTKLYISEQRKGVSIFSTDGVRESTSKPKDTLTNMGIRGMSIHNGNLFVADLGSQVVWKCYIGSAAPTYQFPCHDLVGNNGRVDVADLSSFLVNYGLSCTTAADSALCSKADINDDGVVSIDDLAALLSVYGDCK